MMMELKVKKFDGKASLPVYATDGSGAFDLFANEVNGMKTIGALVYEGHDVTVGTGLGFEIPDGWVMLIFARSGNAFNFGVRPVNCVAVIDSDYRGEVKVKLTCDRADNEHDPVLMVKPGDRVAQGLLVQVPKVSFVEVDQLSETARGEGGLGSTGAR